MWDNLLNLIAKASSLQPSYSAEHCIAVKKSVGACSACRDVCPHEAITIHRKVEIDDIDCTGCGLCIQVCPSQALESRPNYQPGAPLRCSQVKGNTQSVQCLARLQASDLLRLAGNRRKVTLARGDCAACPIGAATVSEALSKLIEEARLLADFTKLELEFQVLVVEKLGSSDNPDPVSRRELLRGGWRGVQHGLADALAPLDPGDDNDAGLPTEMQRRYRLIALSKPAAQTPVPWVLPRVAEGCIMCPVCTNVCPTGAFSREFDPVDEGNGARLKLEPERCMACNACVVSCPVKVISLDENVSWAELAGGSQEVYRKDSRQGLGDSISR